MVKNKKTYITTGGGEGQRKIAGVQIIKKLSKVIVFASDICWHLSLFSGNTITVNQAM